MNNDKSKRGNKSSGATNMKEIKEFQVEPEKEVVE